MSKTSASNYARGTPAFDAVAAQYGDDAAVAQWQAAIDAEKNQTPLDTSTWSIFGNQIYNDPLAAPIEQANTVISNTTDAILKNPFFAVTGIVVAIVIGGALFVWFGGMALFTKKAK